MTEKEDNPDTLGTIQEKLKIIRDLALKKESLTPNEENTLIALLRSYTLQLAVEIDKESSNESHPRSFSDIIRFRQLLTNESDRGCILVGTSLIDEDLKNLYLLTS